MTAVFNSLLPASQRPVEIRISFRLWLTKHAVEQSSPLVSIVSRQACKSAQLVPTGPSAAHSAASTAKNLFARQLEWSLSSSDPHSLLFLVQDCIISTLNLCWPAACHAMALNGYGNKWRCPTISQAVSAIWQTLVHDCSLSSTKKQNFVIHMTPL